MAIKVTEFNKRMDALIATLPSKMLDELERIVLNAKAEVNARIVDTGKDAKGQPLPPYTDGYLQFKKDVGRYRGHVDLQLGAYSINNRIAAVEARKKARGVKRLTKDERESVKKIRRAKAIPTGGGLWRNIGLTEKKEEGKIIRVVVAPRDELNKKKAQGLSIKRGDFLAVSDKEQKNIKQQFENGISKIIVKTFA